MIAPVRYTQGAKLFICTLLSVGLSAFICLLGLIWDVYHQGFIDSINIYPSAILGWSFTEPFY